MFIKIIIGNAAFAAIVWGFYAYVGGDTQRTAEASVVAFAAMAIGAIMGSWLSQVDAKD